MAVGTEARAKRSETVRAMVEGAMQRSARLRPLASSPSGGLSQIPKGGSATLDALKCLGTPQDLALADPPYPLLPFTTYALWVSDEGWLYTPSLHHKWNLSLDRLLLVRVTNAMDVWRLALEAIQTGLFQFAILRPSKLCPPNYLRKLQLTAESTRCQVIVLSEERLPHWVLRKSVSHARSVPPPLDSPDGVQRGLPRSLP